MARGIAGRVGACQALFGAAPWCSAKRIRTGADVFFMGQCRPQPRNAVIPPNEILDSHLRWLVRSIAALPWPWSQRSKPCTDAPWLCDRLERELAHLGYPVTDVILPSDSDLASVVERIERKTRQRIPAVLVEFWKIVGGVSFVDLDAYAHVDFWGDVGVEAEYCDGLRVDAYLGVGGLYHRRLWGPGRARRVGRISIHLRPFSRWIP